MEPTPDELSVPHFEDRLWNELEAMHHERCRSAVPPPAVGRRARRRGPLLVGAAAVAAAVAVVAMLVADVPGSEPPPAAASVVERVLAATDPADGDSIIHETVRRGDGIVMTERWYDQVTAADRNLVLSAAGDPLSDVGWPVAPTADEAPHPDLAGPATELGECDPLSRLSMDDEGQLHPCEPDGSSRPQPTHAYRTVDHCRRVYVDATSVLVRGPGWGYLRMYLETGDIVEDGTEEVDGRDLLRLPNRAGTIVFLVDPETYLPLRLTETGPNGETSISTYERLPRSPENLALLAPPVPEGFTPAEPAPDPGTGSGPVPVIEDPGAPAAAPDCSGGPVGWRDGDAVVEQAPEGD
jgi:hypothetical protein